MTQVQAPKSPSDETRPPQPSKSGVTKYVWITLAMVAVTQLPGFALHTSFVASKVRPPRHQLSELPLVIGPWTGTATELDPRIFAVVGADEQINRLYKNPAGATVTMHCATWTSLNPGMPHGPDLCYGSAGWKLAQSHTRVLPDRPDVTVGVQKFERAGQQVVVVYWYQMDDRAFVDRSGWRRMRRAQWGHLEWPPLSKILLQSTDAEDAEARLQEIATHVYDFISKE
jgi:EpsI family protein